ncbi:MAG: transcription termination factor NusA, partial [Elusimicrobiota bacterium]|nr:transcription termination factor NusA [Elusimicrobiota bacterium]
MKSNLNPMLKLMEKEKGIPRADLIELLESAMTSAFSKHARGTTYTAKIGSESGEMQVFVRKEVVSKVSDETNQISKTDALKIDPAAEIGQTVDVEVAAEKFGRIAAQTAKQIIVQKIKENERENLYDKYKDRVGQILTVKLYRFVRDSAIVEIGDTEAILPDREQIPGERLSRGSSFKVYIVEVTRGSKGPRILVSRTHPGLVEGLFRMEVPEVEEGVVKVLKIVRDPGVRCKAAVDSTNSRVDPIGACVGINGVRVQAVISELGGERIDLIKHSDNIEQYLVNSLSPADVSEVIITDRKKKEARLVVNDDMLSLAIGKNWQNVRLADRLTQWHLDIQSETQLQEIKQKKFT